MGAIDLLPEHVKRDVIAIRSMNISLKQIAHSDIKVARDLSNRISQAMGRLAVWEDTATEAQVSAASELFAASPGEYL